METAMSRAKLKETAEKLVALCREGRDAEALNTLYERHAASVEAVGMPGMSAEIVGVEAIKDKHDWFDSAHEMHGVTVEGPFLHRDDRFGVIFEMDVTNKHTGVRNQFRELAIYHVDEDGMIVREEFFYNS
jgi:hypothetical protein